MEGESKLGSSLIPFWTSFIQLVSFSILYSRMVHAYCRCSSFAKLKIRRVFFTMESDKPHGQDWLWNEFARILFQNYQIPESKPDGKTRSWSEGEGDSDPDCNESKRQKLDPEEIDPTNYCRRCYTNPPVQSITMECGNVYCFTCAKIIVKPTFFCHAFCNCCFKPISSEYLRWLGKFGDEYPGNVVYVNQEKLPPGSSESDQVDSLAPFLTSFLREVSHTPEFTATMFTDAATDEIAKIVLNLPENSDPLRIHLNTCKGFGPWKITLLTICHPFMGCYNSPVSAPIKDAKYCIAFHIHKCKEHVNYHRFMEMFQESVDAKCTGGKKFSEVKKILFARKDVTSVPWPETEIEHSKNYLNGYIIQVIKEMISEKCVLAADGITFLYEFAQFEDFWVESAYYNRGKTNWFFKSSMRHLLYPKCPSGLRVVRRLALVDLVWEKQNQSKPK